jgi:hypothetical protein
MSSNAFLGFQLTPIRKCTSHNKVNIVIKQNPNGAVCIGACLCLRMEES